MDLSAQRLESGNYPASDPHFQSDSPKTISLGIFLERNPHTTSPPPLSCLPPLLLLTPQSSPARATMYQIIYWQKTMAIFV